MSIESRYIAYQNVLYGVIQKRIGAGIANRRN